ncbi:alpha/beta hydrolase [Streptacidiphilus jiangxiensis]|uniref:Alpha/beta hydrolase family protein n=1 Tax=Streptacidiphilus jiangxiensis TaxID=235985 RepID=A0A1H7KIM8_STRJI|nr:alpha/beta hydrolase [Streptacidiphilus jiangxiensis]SEK86733.1 Alpha/beta hydrolase family protein [Streptacidiphilus jiangxiensis]
MTVTTEAPRRDAAAVGTVATTLDAAGVPLSALLQEPDRTPPRAVIVALHGGGMRAGYFDGRAHPDVSLLRLGARLGYSVLAVDRPGYGRSAARFPQGRTLAEQSALLHAALADFARRYPVGAGFHLLGHSYGGKLALTAAAEDGDSTTPRVLGVDVSGCGHRYADDAVDAGGRIRRVPWTWNWGALRFYPPDTFRSSAAIVSAMPEQEVAEAARWPRLFRGIAARIRVPVRFTFAQSESWWRHDEAATAELSAAFPRAPQVVIDRQPDSGHNLSLGWAARSYHLRALGFFEQCLGAPEIQLAQAPLAVG